MKQQTSLERFAIALYDHGFLQGNGNEINQLLEYYKEIYQDEIEAAAIIASAETATAAAAIEHNKLMQEGIALLMTKWTPKNKQDNNTK
jgi:hypothetical protein